MRTNSLSLHNARHRQHKIDHLSSWTGTSLARHRIRAHLNIGIIDSNMDISLVTRCVNLKNIGRSS